ncbi:putative ribonuclease H-like domain-containing protein [Tanacetum coccineum]
MTIGIKSFKMLFGLTAAQDEKNILNGNAVYERKEISQEDMKKSRAPRVQESRNKEATRRTVPIEETTSKALVYQCDGLGYDWSDQAKEGPTNFALMAYTSLGSSSFSSSDPESRLNVVAYKVGLESVEARLDVYKKNEAIFEVDIKILKLDVMLRDNAITELRKKFEKAKKERDDLKLTLEKFENEVVDSVVNNKYKTSEGYHAIPPPYIGNFMPLKPDLVLVGEDEYVFSESVNSVKVASTSEVKTSESEPKSVSEPIIEDWVSDSENEDEIMSKSEQRKPSNARIKFVKSYKHVKSSRESVKKVEEEAKYLRKNSQSPRGNKRNWNNLMTQKLGSDFEFKNKACFVCGSFNHLIKDCDFYEKKMVEKPIWNNARRVNHQNSQKITHPHPKRNFVPRAVLMKSGLKTLKTARQSSSRAAVSVNTARPINTAYQRPTVNCARPASNVFKRAQSHVSSPFNKSTTNKNSNYNEKVNIVRGNVTTTGPKVVGNPQLELQKKRVIDNGCSRHMTGNKSYLSDYEEIDGGFVAFGGNSKGGKITGKGKIRTGKLDFEDVYFVKELNFNLFSVSQMCDKKNSVLFTDTECVILSFDFKLTDKNHVLLKVPRKDNMYCVDLRNVVPQGGLTCLFTKATLYESNLWHRRLGMKQFCEMKGIKREISVVRTPQQNRVAKRKNRTLIEAARTMLADSKLLTTFWAEAVNTSCYVHNRVLVITPHNKIPYELFLGRKHALSFMRPFGCLVTILNTLDHLGKFDGKADDGFFVGYSVNIVVGNQSNGNACTKENVDAGQVGKKDVLGKDYILLPLWTQDLLNSSNSKDSPDVGFKPSGEEEKKDEINAAGIEDDVVDENIMDADMTNLDSHIPVRPIPTTRIHKDHPLSQIIGDIMTPPQTRRMTRNKTEHEEPKKVIQALKDPSWIEVMQEELLNKLDERGIVIRNKARLVAQGHTQEEGINYDEIFALVVRIEAIRLFLAYASYKDFMVYQMDVKSAFLYGKIEDDVYVCQPPDFEDPYFPDRVYKVEKPLYGLHQAPRAWYETLSTYLLENGFQRGQIDKTLFIKKDQGDILLVQVYVDDIIFGSTKKKLCTEFEKIMHKKFQMSSMGELTFFLGLQVKQKEDGIFISQDKYVTEILKKFGFSDVKTASTPMETHKSLLKDANDIMFTVCVCARFQVNPKVSHLHAVKRIFRYLKGQPKLGLWYPKDSPFDLVAYIDSDYVGASLDRKSTTGAEYIAASNCCGQVLWIQNQLLDYGYNFMNTKIFIDNKSTICIVKNLVFHSKTKHIEIKHHFIRDSKEKKLIQMIKIHTDQNVADLLTKAFDVSRFQYLIASIGMLNL